MLHVLPALPEGSPDLLLLPLQVKNAPHRPILTDLEIRYGAEYLRGIAYHPWNGEVNLPGLIATNVLSSAPVWLHHSLMTRR